MEPKPTSSTSFTQNANTFLREQLTSSISSSFKSAEEFETSALKNLPKAYQFQSKEAKFFKSLSRFRQKHLFFSEQKTLHKKDALKRFLAHLKTCREERLPHFISCLDSKEISYVFPSLLYTEDARTLDYLFRILQQRPSWYLYASAWHCLQHCFPHPTVLNAFFTLCEALQKQKSLLEERPYFLAEDVCEKVYVGMETNDFYQLILSYFQGLHYHPLEQKRKTLGLESQSVLFLHLMNEYLSSCSLGDFHLAKDYYIPCLHLQEPRYSEVILLRILQNPLSSHEEQAKLISLLCQHFSPFHPLHPLWKQVPTHLLQSYRKIALAQTLQEYCNKQPLKLAFYKEWLDEIQDIHPLNDQALALKCRHFLLIDNPSSSFSIYFYLPEAVEDLLIHQAYELKDLSFPSFEMVTLHAQLTEDDLRKITRCRLPLSESSVELSHQFLRRFL